VNPFAIAPVTLLAYLLLFVPMGLGMAYVLTLFFPRRGGPATVASATVAIGIRLMALGLWSALIFAIVDPGDASVVSVFIALNSMMAIVGCWALSLFLRAEEHRLPKDGVLWPALVAVLVVGNEFLMGVTFVLGQVGAAPYGGAAGLVRLAVDAVLSPWFSAAMLANMGFAIAWIPIPPGERFVLLGFSASGALASWVALAPLSGSIATGLLMTVVVAAIVDRVRRDAGTGAYVRIAMAISAGFGVMAAATLLFVAAPWTGVPSGTPLALESLLVMGAETALLARWGFGGFPVPPAGASAPPPAVPHPTTDA